MMRELLSSYLPAQSRYDEMLAAPSMPRTHWQRMFEQLGAMPPEAMRERAHWLQRQVRENGVTYNVYAGPGFGRRLCPVRAMGPRINMN